MRFEQFEAFITVSKTHSVRKASELLFSTPQNISKMIISLETELNVILFNRNVSGMELTEDGEKAYSIISEILDKKRALYELFKNESANAPTVLYPVNILTSPLLVTYIESIVRFLYPLFPKTIININQDSYKRINANNKKIEKNDIILTSIWNDNINSINRRFQEKFCCFSLFTDELRIQVPKDSTLAEKPFITFKELENLPVMVFDIAPDESYEFEKFFKQYGCKLNKLSRISNLETFSLLALSSKRPCFVGYPSVELRPLPNTAFIPLEKPFYIENIILIKKDMINKNFCNSFIEHIDQYFDIKQLF